MKLTAEDNLDGLLRGVIQNLFGNNSTDSSYKLLEMTPEEQGFTSGSFGSQVLSAAQKDLGVREDLGKNDGKRIREYFKYFDMGGGQDWCAAAVSAWIREAGGGPIQGAVGARNVGSQFAQIGKWVPQNKITPQAMTPGNIVVWSRGGPDSWKGHIGVLESFDGNNSFTSIEGNSGPRSDSVVRNSHSIKDSNLLGIGILSDYVPKSKNAHIIRIEKLANLFYQNALRFK